MLFKKLAITGAALALTVATVGAGTAFAAAPVAGTGSTGSCLFTGKAQIKPAIVIGGTIPGGPTKVGGKLGTKTTPCSGGTNEGATLASGSVKGVIPAAATNDCLALATVGLNPFSLGVKWKTDKGAAKVLPSTINVAATPPGGINLAGPGGSIQITLTGTGAATDAKGKPQSFVGNAFTTVATTDQTLADFTTGCTPPSKGLKGFTFTGVNGPSTLSS